MLLGEVTFASAKTKKLVSLGGSALNGAISGGGTGALVGLIAKPKSGTAQRKLAIAGAAIGAGVNTAKKLMTKPSVPRIKKPKV